MSDGQFDSLIRLIISISILDKETSKLSSRRYQYTFSMDFCFETFVDFKRIMPDGFDRIVA